MVGGEINLSGQGLSDHGTEAEEAAERRGTRTRLDSRGNNNGQSMAATWEETHTHTQSH